MTLRRLFGCDSIETRNEYGMAYRTDPTIPICDGLPFLNCRGKFGHSIFVSTLDRRSSLFNVDFMFR